MESYKFTFYIDGTIDVTVSGDDQFTAKQRAYKLAYDRVQNLSRTRKNVQMSIEEPEPYIYPDNWDNELRPEDGSEDLPDPD